MRSPLTQRVWRESFGLLYQAHRAVRFRSQLTICEETVIEMIDRCLVGLTTRDRLGFAAGSEDRKYHIIGVASECVLTRCDRAAILNPAFRAPPSPRAGPS